MKWAPSQNCTSIWMLSDGMGEMLLAEISQTGGRWKRPLEIIQSNLAPNAGSLRAGCPGWSPGSFGISPENGDTKIQPAYLQVVTDIPGYQHIRHRKMFRGAQYILNSFKSLVFQLPEMCHTTITCRTWTCYPLPPFIVHHLNWEVESQAVIHSDW